MTALRQTTSKRRAAKVISEVFGPGPLGTLLLLTGAMHPDPSAHNLVSGLVAVIFITGGPLTALFLLSRRGLISGHHISVQKERTPVLIAVFGSALLGTALLFLWGSPYSLYQMIFGLVLGLAVVFAVNLFWKVSVHAAVSSYFATTLVGVFGVGAVWVVLIPISVAVSRVVLAAHTKAQVYVGLGVGLVVAVAYLAVGPLIS